jgi:hypothetical protein
LLLLTDETDCKRLVAGRTLNHTHRKPYVPLPPALPRFSLPNEGAETAAKEQAFDPLDAAATAQRPALTGVKAKRVVRATRASARRPVADATEEVQVEDILLEVYAEDPPPPISSIAMAIAASVPPPPAQSAAVDALLRASDPAFAPYPHHLQHAQHAPGFASSAPHDPDLETPSVAPVMMASTVPPGPAPAPAARPNRAAAVAIWSALLLVVGVAAAGAVMFGIRNGTYARLRDGARSVAVRTPHSAPVAASPAPPASPAPVAVVVAPPAPSPVLPTVSVDSLPKPAIAADASLVTFPAYAQGHRVFVDGRVLAVTDGAPATIKCGRHVVKIGSGRKSRVLDFACGREVIVQ